MDNEFEKEEMLPEEEQVEKIPVPEVTEAPAAQLPKPDAPVTGQLPPKEEAPKVKKLGIKLVAVALVCTILGGLCGAGGTILGLYVLKRSNFISQFAGVTGVLQGIRENSVIDIEEIDTNKLMTPAEVYAANVHSTVGIMASANGNGQWGNQVVSQSAGSGFILSGDGYVLTNYHVVEGMTSIYVTLYDKRELPASLVGYDESNDIAVLKVIGDNLSPVILGDSDNLNVGDSVVAIGNPLGELSFTLTAGLISAKDRTIVLQSGQAMTLLQTDCPINAGNSGGALFNMYGEVIGITNAKYSNNGSHEASIDNIGFAIPMNRVKEIVFSIIEKGVVVKPYVGISVNDVTDQMLVWGVPKGAWIKEVVADSPAEEGGLRIDDIITHMNGTAVDSGSSLVTMVSECHPGDRVVFTVYRGGRTETVTIIMGEKIQPAK